MAQSLKIAEYFYSIQGEGLYAGVPAVFVRLAGCNLTCPGWGTTGCDTTEVWRHTKFDLTPKEFLNKVFDEFRPGKGTHLVITGGEPFLQKVAVKTLLLEAVERNLTTEIETNATIVPEPGGMFANLYTCSPKLRSAGNSILKAYVPTALDWFAAQRHDSAFSVWKFVVQREEDITEIEGYYIRPFNLRRDRVFLMPEGATKEAVEEHSLQVIEWCKRFGFRFSPRLQLMLYNQACGV